MHALGHVHARPGDAAAAVFSLLIPGAGQMYKGRYVVGFAWLVFTTLGYFTLVGPVSGLLLHFLCIFHAYGTEPAS